MLKALYDYAIRNKLTIPSGFVRKTIKAYISLSSQTDYVGIVMGDDEAVPCPDIGSLANGTSKSNVVVEKRSVVVPESNTAKSDFFLAALKSAGQYDVSFALCANVLEDSEKRAKIISLLDEKRIKQSDRISFMVDNISLLESDMLVNWWKPYRAQLIPQTGGALPCLITGEMTAPLMTTPSIQGLRVVGGHASGDALLCFDKSAFCSYGLKQGENAPVSEEAFGAVKAALDSLLADAPILAGMKFVHWYDREIQPEKDPVVLSGIFGDIADEEDDDEPEEMSSAELRREERDERHKADRLVKSAESGEADISLGNAVYHILMLSGVGGRIMIRRYETGNYVDLKRNIDLWNEQLSLVTPWGAGNLKSCKLTARLIRLLKYQTSDSNTFERLSKELSNTTGAVIGSIITGSPLPDTVAARALHNIRSVMLSDEEDRDKVDREVGRMCQWLKVWLMRRSEKGKQLMTTFNTESQNTAYCCGALMALYVRIQQAANPGVNSGVEQRYYSSAIQTPALVIGRLSQLSVNHLRDIEKTSVGLAVYFRDQLAEIYRNIDGAIPSVLKLEDQSQFALGYYQKYAQLRAKKDKEDK